MGSILSFFQLYMFVKEVAGQSDWEARSDLLVLFFDGSPDRKKKKGLDPFGWEGTQ